MKKVLFTTAIVSIFASCNNTSNQKNQESQEIQSIGGNKDKNGCLTAAGQIWSQIKNDCIQVFSVGIRLNPVKIDSTAAIISAFVVPNDNNTAYELFIADREETLILNKSADHTFSKDQYKYLNNSGELLINDTLYYKSE